VVNFVRVHIANGQLESFSHDHQISPEGNPPITCLVLVLWEPRRGPAGGQEDFHHRCNCFTFGALSLTAQGLGPAPPWFIFSRE
jgi:hypothetical protein